MRSATRRVAVSLASVLLLAGTLALAFAPPAFAPPVPFYWESTGGGSGFLEVSALVYDAARDVLYAGTRGVGVWRCDDPGSPASAWSDTGIDASANMVNSLAYDPVHDILYAGTTDGLWRCEDPSGAPSWTQPPSAVFGCPINAMAYDAVHDLLYAGWFDGGSASYMGLWRCNNPRDPNPDWTNITAGAALGGRIDSLAYDSARNILYAGCAMESILPPAIEGRGVWRCADPDSSPSWTDLGSGAVDSFLVFTLALDPLGNFLYAGTDGHGVWRCSDPSGTPSWTDIGGGFGASWIEALVYDPNNNALYAGGRASLGVRQCLNPDTAPDWAATGGDIGSYFVMALALDPYRFVLYADCYDLSTLSKKDVYRAPVAPASCWYFAEGYTGSGFQEYLCLGNPGTADITARVSFVFPDGTAHSQYHEVPALSRVTVDVNGAVGTGKNVSMLITSPTSGLIAERPMYFDYTGAGAHWTGGHNAVGATGAYRTWYFAEGYTGYGFEEWICVLNPGDAPAELTFNFQTQEQGLKKVEGYSVPAHSRGSFKANDLLGGGSFQTSLALESSQPVVAERPMYFSYQGLGAWNWTGGHCVMGTPFLATEYYFAEGCTLGEFEEWLTLQNPSSSLITVQATYMLKTGETVEREYTVGANRRETVLVNDSAAGVGPGQEVSVYLSCPDPFLAERPMYFNYQGLGARNWTGGHCVIGATYPWAEWFLAEGYTGTGFEEWICIQNPQPSDAAVTVVYLPEEGADPITRHHTVKANSRFTIPVNTDAGEGISLSAKLEATVPVVVERPMYFSYGPGGWTGGHDVVGYAP